MKKRVHYLSTVNGVAKTESGRETFYYGLTVRMPQADFPDKLEEYITREIDRIDRFINSLPDDEEVGEPLERYEVYDTESDDVLVMWRIPIH